MTLQHNNTILNIHPNGNIEVSGNYTDAAYALLSYILDLNLTVLGSRGFANYIICNNLYVNVKTLEISYQEFVCQGTPASFHLLKEQYDKLLALKNFV